jgi:hypothetical protein
MLAVSPSGFCWGAQEFTGHNVVADIRAKQREDKDQTLTADDCANLMAHVDQHDGDKHARFFAIALFAGVRPEGELNKLEERDVEVLDD